MRKIPFYGMLFLTVSLAFVACQKSAPVNKEEALLANMSRNNQFNGHLQQTKTFSSDVAVKWMSMQVFQIRNYPALIGNVAYARQYAYSGVALYEAVVPGMPAYQSIASQLNGLSGLPKAKPGLAYHWGASANAALAFLNKKMFLNSSTANKTAMDNLENEQLAQFSTEANAEVINRSVEFGKAVAEAVYNWSETDGYKQVNDPYTPPAGKVGGIYWTPPNPLNVNSLPYLGNLRRLFTSSGNGAETPAPDYNALKDMTIDVINSKPAVATNEYNIAFWWRDFPGTSTPGHYVSILRQVLQKQQPSLDVAAIAYALGGITVMETAISTWQDKYKYLLARPFNYAAVIPMTFTSWLGAPHPEYPAAHASLSMGNAEAMTSIFGENFSFTDSTFFGLVTPQSITLQPRSYSSFRAAGEEAGWSRLYGGIHYRKSIEIGFWQGQKVFQNIKTGIKFLKDTD